MIWLAVTVVVPLFPGWEAKVGLDKRKPTKKPEWRPTATQQLVLKELVNLGEATELEIYASLGGRVGTLSAVTAAIDVLAKRGLVVDTGKRGQWTRKGRMFVWRAA